MLADKLPPVMPLGNQVALWVMDATRFLKISGYLWLGYHS